MIGVILNSRVKIINRDKYISLYGEDSVSKSNVFGKFVTVKYCFENGEKFLCADDHGKEYILSQIVLLMLIMLKREASLMKQRISAATADSLTMVMQ